MAKKEIKSFDYQLSKIGGQIKEPEVVPSGAYLGFGDKMVRVGNNIPDNLTEPSGSEYCSEEK